MAVTGGCIGPRSTSCGSAQLCGRCHFFDAITQQSIEAPFTGEAQGQSGKGLAQGHTASPRPPLLQAALSLQWASMGPDECSGCPLQSRLLVQRFRSLHLIIAPGDSDPEVSVERFKRCDPRGCQSNSSVTPHFSGGAGWWKVSWQCCSSCTGSVRSLHPPLRPNDILGSRGPLSLG